MLISKGDVMPSYIDKYNIKREGLDLEKEDPEEAIKFYKDLLNDELFVNENIQYQRHQKNHHNY